jgi:signal transduction histidine kinase
MTVKAAAPGYIRMPTPRMHAIETHFRSLADSLPQLVCVVDESGRVSYGNSSWYEFMGIGAGSPFLASFLPALHPLDRSLWEQTWQQAVASGEPYLLERRVRLTTQSSYVQQLERGNPVRDRDGKVAEWILIAAAADENERVVAQLQRSLADKDRFLALLAHEMRGPLAPLSSALQILALHVNEPQVVRQSSTMMARQLAQLVRLVDDLLDLARSQNAQIPLKCGPLDLESAIRAAVEAAQPLITSHGHHLTLALSADTMMVDGDAGRLTQVFANLLINAAKFTDDGGKICVSIEREADWALVRVRDSGIGIRRDMLGRVFDAYVQAEHGSVASRAGLGLGLALVRHLIELHGGTVNAYSEGPGRGSEFIVRLPSARGPVCLPGCPASACNSALLT